MAKQKNKETKKKSNTIAFSASDTLTERLDEISDELDITRSQLIRLYLDSSINLQINLPGISLQLTELCRQINDSNTTMDENTFHTLSAIINNLINLLS